jgi:hypothetical protein
MKSFLAGPAPTTLGYHQAPIPISFGLDGAAGSPAEPEQDASVRHAIASLKCLRQTVEANAEN